MLKSLYERVAERCNRGGLPVGAQGVAEVDGYLTEEKRRCWRAKKLARRNNANAPAAARTA